jgi:hypothetical protein
MAKKEESHGSMLVMKHLDPFETNHFHKWTIRHWLFDHWQYYRKWKINQLKVLTQACIQYRDKILWMGSTVLKRPEDKKDSTINLNGLDYDLHIDKSCFDQVETNLKQFKDDINGKRKRNPSRSE